MLKVLLCLRNCETIALSIDHLHTVLANFKWNEEPLEMAGIGVPSSHIKNLTDGCFKQQLTINMKRSTAIQLNQYQKLELDLGQEDEFLNISSEDIEEQEVFIGTLDSEAKQSVETVLFKISSDIKASLSKRIEISSLVRKSIMLFHNTSWFDEYKTDAFEKAEENLKHLYSSHNLDNEGFPTCHDALPGFLNFLKFKSQPRFLETRVEEVYQLFFSSSKKEPDNKAFFTLF